MCSFTLGSSVAQALGDCGLAYLPSFSYSDTSPRIRHVLEMRRGEEGRITELHLGKLFCIFYYKNSKIVSLKVIVDFKSNG